MKKGWKTKTLGELLSVLRNGVNCKQDKSGTGDKISRIETISDATFDINRVGYARLNNREKERFRLIRGDILFSHINSAIHVGKTAIFESDEEVYHGVNLLLMRPSSEVIPSYLQNFLKFIFQSGYWRSVCKQSVNQASVNQQDISLVRILFPSSLAEQKRIVALLDEAFAGLATAQANAEKNLQNARALFESQLQTVFSKRGEGWVEKRLGEICMIGDGNHSSNYPRKEDLVESGVPFIRATNIVHGRISGEDMRFLSPEKHEELRKGHLKTGDILITNRGEIGKTAIIEETYNNSNLNSQIAWLRCGKDSNNRFLFHALNSPAIQAHFQSSKNGAALQQFTIRQLRELKLPQPLKEEQASAADALDALSAETQRLARIYEQKQAALAALKKSLLHEAFSGAL